MLSDLRSTIEICQSRYKIKWQGCIWYVCINTGSWTFLLFCTRWNKSRCLHLFLVLLQFQFVTEVQPEIGKNILTKNLIIKKMRLDRLFIITFKYKYPKKSSHIFSFVVVSSPSPPPRHTPIIDYAIPHSIFLIYDMAFNFEFDILCLLA